jgi:hypothetical protein
MNCMTRQDILYRIIYRRDSPNGILQLHLTAFDHYAPGCRWKKMIGLENLPHQDGPPIRYVVEVRADQFLVARPRWDVLEEALEMMDTVPGLQSINLTPLAQMEDPIDEDWRLCSGSEEGVKLLRVASAVSTLPAPITIPHLAWVRDGTHANALLLGPWPVRFDAVEGDQIREWALEFAEREGVLLRGPSLR